MSEPLIPCPTPVCTPDPTGHRIAFTSDRLRNGYEIYAMNGDGTCPAQLTNFWNIFTKNEARRPTWSPDGRQILFELYHDTSYLTEDIDLYTVTAEGGQVSRIAWGQRNCDAKWSPDGSRIAFKSDRSQEIGLYVMDADGSNQKRLTDLDVLECRYKESTQEWNYGWSPDGKQIAFTGINPVSRQHDVYLVDLESEKLVNLTDNPAKDVMIAWWPQKKKILFHSNRLREKSGIQNLVTLFMMDADGTNVQRIIDFPPIIVPPNGSNPNEYYMRGWVERETSQIILTNIYQGGVYILDVACTIENTPEFGKMPRECRQLFPKPLFETVSRVNHETLLSSVDDIYWTTNAPKLTFGYTEYPGAGLVPADDIVVTEYDGAGVVNLTSCSADDKDPAWSPAK